MAKKSYKELLAENKKLLAIKNPKSTTVATTKEAEKPKAIQGQPIEILASAIKEKAEKRFYKDSIEVCPNSDGGMQIFGSTFVGGKGGFRGKLNCYIADRKAFAQAILDAPHNPRTDV